MTEEVKVSTTTGKPKRPYVIRNPKPKPEMPAYKKFYLKHHEKVLEQKRTKFICECGSSYSLSGKTYHQRTKKHIEFKNNISI